jgi:hypothetical protein
MNIQKFCLTIAIPAFSTFCFAQSADSVSTVRKSSNLTVSYNSSLIYPGTRFGVEFPLETIFFTKINRSGKKKDFIRDRFVTSGFSWYHHPEFHDNLYLTGGWTMRRTKSNGFLTEFSPEIGLSRTFLGGTTYQVDENGIVTRKKLAGYIYALVSIGGGIGYDFSIVKRKPFAIFSKFNVLMMFPYNSTVYLRPAAEIGIIYKPVNFLSLKVKSKHLNKNIN